MRPRRMNIWSKKFRALSQAERKQVLLAMKETASRDYREMVLESREKYDSRIAVAKLRLQYREGILAELRSKKQNHNSHLLENWLRGLPWKMQRDIVEKFCKKQIEQEIKTLKEILASAQKGFDFLTGKLL